jgi:L-methionine (R)-S-oxide reductase|tara:strand:+ start:5943 stop:6395 length:453 start_codon:yes stop_codon:yes gene_type:complete
MNFNELKPKISDLVSRSSSLDATLKEVCELLKTSIPYYDWVGFYFKNGEKEELKIGPYAGATTDHTIIPFGKGICGQVAVSNKNFVVADVSSQDNYIACSLSVKSEIVIPLFVNNVNIGQLDIDSNTIDPFTHEDERFLEFVCESVASIM